MPFLEISPEEVGTVTPDYHRERFDRKKHLERMCRAAAAARPKVTQKKQERERIEEREREVQVAAHQKQQLVCGSINSQEPAQFEMLCPYILVAHRTIKAVAAEFDTSFKDILSFSHRASMSNPRHIAMYLLHTHTGISYLKIARFFHREHATVMSAVQKISQMREKDWGLSAKIRKIECLCGFSDKT